MSRKSRVHGKARAKSERGFARFVLIALGLVIAAYFALTVAVFLQDDPCYTPIPREEAVQAEVTLQAATRVRGKVLSYRLRFADHEPLRISFGAEDIKGAENWPAGTHLTLLLHPLDESYVVSLTKDGEELIRFDDYLAWLPTQRMVKTGTAAVCGAMSLAGAAVLGFWYTRRMREISRKETRV